jgi:hypothetical protein
LPIPLEYAVQYVQPAGIGAVLVSRVHEAGQHAVNGEQVSETMVIQSSVR